MTVTRQTRQLNKTEAGQTPCVSTENPPRSNRASVPVLCVLCTHPKKPSIPRSKSRKLRVLPSTRALPQLLLRAQASSSPNSPASVHPWRRCQGRQAPRRLPSPSVRPTRLVELHPPRLLRLPVLPLIQPAPQATSFDSARPSPLPTQAARGPQPNQAASSTRTRLPRPHQAAPVPEVAGCFAGCDSLRVRRQRGLQRRSRGRASPRQSVPDRSRPCERRRATVGPGWARCEAREEERMPSEGREASA